MNHADILRYLDGVPLQKAFQSDEVTADEVARVLLDMASERLRAENLSPEEAKLVGIKMVFDDPEELDEEELALSEGEPWEVNPHLYVQSKGNRYHLWGDLIATGAKLEGKIDRIRKEEPKRVLPKIDWREVFDAVGLVGTPETERFLELSPPRRGVSGTTALYEKEMFIRPDQLPILRMPAGDNLCLRFDPRSGEVLDYALVMHDEQLTIPMGTSLAATIKFCGVQVGDELGESWQAFADAVAGGAVEGFEELAADLQIEMDWRWKLRVQEGLESLSEASCREWLDTCADRTGPAFVRNTRYLTNTAFAAARLGDTERAVTAVVAALRLPARDGDVERYALTLLDQLGTALPDDLKVLGDCLRSSTDTEQVQALVDQANNHTQSGEHEAAYQLLMRAAFDTYAIETPELLERLLEAARAVGYEPVAKVLAARLGVN